MSLKLVMPAAIALLMIAGCKPADKPVEPTASEQPAAVADAAAQDQYNKDEAEMADARHPMDLKSADGKTIIVTYYEQDGKFLMDMERDGSKVTLTQQGGEGDNAVYTDGKDLQVTSSNGGGKVEIKTAKGTEVFE